MLDRLRRLVARLSPSGDLTQRAAKGGLWLAGANASNRVLLLIRLLVVARIVGPDGIGLFTFAALALTVADRFSELGVDAALIRHPADDVDDYLDTVWVITIVRGLVLAGLLYLSAPYVAAFFDSSAVVGLVRLIAVAPLIYGVRNPAVLYFEKSFRFDRRFVFQTGGILANTAVAIGLAVYWADAPLAVTVSALVWGTIAGEVVQTALSYVLHDFRPWRRFGPTVAQARELFSYGKWLTATSILTFLLNEGDDAFVGWLLGEGPTGLYRSVYQFSNAPATEVTKVISRVVFPAYAEVQHDAHALREGYFRTLTLSTLASFPAAVGILVVAPTFLLVVLPDFSAGVIAMQILALWGLIRSLTASTGPLFEAINRPRVVTVLQAVKLVLIATTIGVLLFGFRDVLVGGGIELIAAVILVYAFLVDLLGGMGFALRQIDATVRRFARVVGPPLFASALMGVAVYALQTALETGVASLFAQIAFGVVAYGVVVFGLDRLGYGGLDVVRETLDALRS